MALDTNLTAYYKFDNSAVTLDSVGSFTLTNTGTVASTASGKIGYGADFGNPNTTKWLTQAGFTFNSYPISISGWFYPNVVNDNGNLFSLGESSTNYYQIKLRNTDSHIVFRSNNATDAADVDTGVVASTNTWYHVVVVFNSTTNVDIYVNGTATNTGATVFVAGSLSKFAIGALARGTPIQPYSGIADEVGWWTKALTSGEVTSLYNGGTGVQYPFSTAYSIVFALGTYTYTGFDIAFTKALNMIFALGTYAYTGFDILFSIGKGIVFETGSYIYTGFDIGLNKALTMAFAVGSYTYTGFDILFNKGISMVIATGSYIYTGYNILLRRGGWRNTSKNSTTWTDQSKSSTTWTNTDKSI